MKKLFLIPILAISFAHAYDIKPTDEVDEVIRAEKLVKSHPKLQNKDIHITYFEIEYDKYLKKEVYDIEVYDRDSEIEYDIQIDRKTGEFLKFKRDD